MHNRKTRDSVIDGTFEPPFRVFLRFMENGGLLHAVGVIDGATRFQTCCRWRFTGNVDWATDAPGPTCLVCVSCLGCYCCRAGHVRGETTRMGKWESRDGRRLYPFEMDPVHLRNTIAKLRRERTRFHRNWEMWAETLEYEAKLRGMV